jgi:hypothetical protein
MKTKVDIMIKSAELLQNIGNLDEKKLITLQYSESNTYQRDEINTILLTDLVFEQLSNLDKIVANVMNDPGAARIPIVDVCDTCNQPIKIFN